MIEPDDEPSRAAAPRDASPARGPAGLLIRAAEPSDAEAFAALVNLPGFLAGTAQLPFQTIASSRGRLERNEPGWTHVVAVLGDMIVGSASLHRLQGRRAHAAGLGMGVHDDHVGRGVGTALLGALLDVADNSLALGRVELTVYADNRPAIRLYERAGFEREGLHRRFAVRDGALVDALAMARLRP
jgi:putative acetyltransferase